MVSRFALWCEGNTHGIMCCRWDSCLPYLHQNGETSVHLLDAKARFEDMSTNNAFVVFLRHRELRNKKALQHIKNIMLQSKQPTFLDIR